MLNGLAIEEMNMKINCVRLVSCDIGFNERFGSMSGLNYLDNSLS